jgi:hypothetical protein
MGRTGYVACIGDRTGSQRVVAGRTDGTHHLDGRGADQKDNVKTDPEKVGWRGMTLTVLDHDRDRRRELVNAVMNLRVP